MNRNRVVLGNTVSKIDAKSVRGRAVKAIKSPLLISAARYVFIPIVPCSVPAVACTAQGVLDMERRRLPDNVQAD